MFHGWPRRRIVGIAEASPTTPCPSGRTTPTTRSGWPRRSRSCWRAGSPAPTAWRSAPQGYTGVVETTEHGGLVVFDHLRQILGGPIVWAPGVTGAVLVSMRGGDFLFESGEDLSIGYDHHDADQVHLYLEESYSFRVASPTPPRWRWRTERGGAQASRRTMTQPPSSRAAAA